VPWLRYVWRAGRWSAFGEGRTRAAVFWPSRVGFASGVAMLGTFLGLLIAAFIEKRPGAIGFWTLMTAGETVAWRVKWVACQSQLRSSGWCENRP
jgi:hypothetical protein